MGNGGVRGGCGHRGKKEGIDGRRARAVRAGGGGRVHAMAEDVCERRPDRVRSDEAALLDADRQKRAALKRSEEHTSALQSQSNIVCRLLLEQNNTTIASIVF